MAETFKTMFKIEATYVPYKGSVPALNDLMGGHVNFMFADVPPALGAGAGRKAARPRRDARRRAWR